jgi:hypothetical protein
VEKLVKTSDELAILKQAGSSRYGKEDPGYLRRCLQMIFSTFLSSPSTTRLHGGRAELLGTEISAVFFVVHLSFFRILKLLCYFAIFCPDFWTDFLDGFFGRIFGRIFWTDFLDGFFQRIFWTDFWTDFFEVFFGRIFWTDVLDGFFQRIFSTDFLKNFFDEFFKEF